MSREVLEWAETICEIDIGDYHLEHSVGAGKKGVVYQAYDKSLPSRAVALKLVFGDLPKGWEKELEKVSALDKVPGVVQLLHIGSKPVNVKFNGREEVAHFTVWQLIAPCRNLNDYLKSDSRVDVSFHIAVVERILKVLHAVEVKEVKRHGDLHGGNILIGEPDPTDLDAVGGGDDTIYVADFGYGATGGEKTPKDDYEGLRDIATTIGEKVDWDLCSGEDRDILSRVNKFLSKCVNEPQKTERQKPADLYRHIREIKKLVKNPASAREPESSFNGFKVGYFQNSEMFGDDWSRWNKLFVANVPARSQILDASITSIITGPRGCGKTTLFRRMSLRLVLECGGHSEFSGNDFVGFYINANDIADAFPDLKNEFIDQLTVKKVTAFFNLCFLADFVAALSALKDQNFKISQNLIFYIGKSVSNSSAIRGTVQGEDKIAKLRTDIEEAKRAFIFNEELSKKLSLSELGHHVWLGKFISDQALKACDGLTGKHVFIFVDDYTLPRIPPPMQKILNRILLKRSEHYLVKIATEAATTFIPNDTSDKSFQINDDYAFIDLGGESLAMSLEERETFLGSIFKLRLESDSRIPPESTSLDALLGRLSMSQNEFALRLKAKGKNPLYHGVETFVGMWSGDTRTMIQLMQELSDDALEKERSLSPIPPKVQNNAYMNKGGQWVADLRNCEPSDHTMVKNMVENMSETLSDFKGLVQDKYGYHLKAVVEAFKRRARRELNKKLYKQGANDIARSAFRIEIQDELRITGLAYQIYSDLIRYGIFLRDERGRSTRGAVVPRLYLRRLAIPFCTLAITKKNCIRITNKEFESLLLDPDNYATANSDLSRENTSEGQLDLGIIEDTFFVMEDEDD